MFGAFSFSSYNQKPSILFFFKHGTLDLPIQMDRLIQMSGFFRIIEVEEKKSFRYFTFKSQMSFKIRPINI
jgi:hypothetical protein